MKAPSDTDRLAAVRIAAGYGSGKQADLVTAWLGLGSFPTLGSAPATPVTIAELAERYAVTPRRAEKELRHAVEMTMKRLAGTLMMLMKKLPEEEMERMMDDLRRRNDARWRKTAGL